MSKEALGVGAGAGVGGYLGGTDGALMGAQFGQLAGGALARFTTSCFAAGTPLVVDLEGNSKPIEDIQVGEFVLARSELDADGPLELKRVEELFVRVSPVIELVVKREYQRDTPHLMKKRAGWKIFVPNHRQWNRNMRSVPFSHFALSHL